MHHATGGGEAARLDRGIAAGRERRRRRRIDRAKHGQFVVGNGVADDGAGLDDIARDDNLARVGGDDVIPSRAAVVAALDTGWGDTQPLAAAEIERNRARRHFAQVGHNRRQLADTEVLSQNRRRLDQRAMDDLDELRRVERAAVIIADDELARAKGVADRVGSVQLRLRRPGVPVEVLAGSVRRGNGVVRALVTNHETRPGHVAG